MTSTIAIDFGTSNTVVARWNPATHAPETLSLGELSLRQAPNPPVVPSLLYVEDAAQGQVQLGQAVRDRGLDHLGDGRLFRSFKRGIGSPVQGFLPELDGRSVDFEQAGEWFLGGLARALAAQDYCDSQTTLVLTVPVDSFEAYRHWLTRAIAHTPLRHLHQVRLLDEPTAAALGYGFKTGGKPGLDDRPHRVLVVDFGGGTLDLSLVEWEPGARAQPIGFLLQWAGKVLERSAQRPQTARVLAKAGLNLGGVDLDHWVLEQFGHLPPTSLLLRLAERLKLALSSQESANEVFFDPDTCETIELNLSRPQFEQVLRDRGFFAQLDGAMAQVLQQARRAEIEPEAIDAVLLVGGSSQIPAVRDWLEGYFPPEKIAADKPLEAIALGALSLGQGLQVSDFLYHGYGIRYWDRRQNCHNWQPLIAQGQPYPMTQPIELILGASVDNQPGIELVIGEMGGGLARTEIFFSGDRLITRSVEGPATVQPLNDRDGSRRLADLDPPGTPGSDRVRLLFWVDGERSLRVTVEDLLTQRTLLEGCAIAQLT